MPCMGARVFWGTGEPSTEGLGAQGCRGETYLESLKDG